MNRLALLIFLISAILVGCGKSKPETDTARSAYELVADWPQLPQGFVFSQPTGVGVDTQDHIFVFHRAGRKWVDPFPDSLISLNTILEFENGTGKLLNSWGANQFIMPHGLAVDQNDNVWVTDVALQQIFKFSHEGQLLMKVGVQKIPGNDSLHFNRPTDVAVAPDGSFYVSDGYKNSRVVKFSPSGKYMMEWGTYGNKPGEFDIPHGIALDRSGNVYVADRQNNRIQVFSSTGSFLEELKNNESVKQLPSVVINQEQQIIGIDYDFTIPTDVKGSTIFKYDSVSNVQFHFGETGEGKRTKSFYHDVAVDKQGNIYVGDIIGLKVLKFRIKSTDH